MFNEYVSVFLECPKSVDRKKCKIYIFCHKRRIIFLIHVNFSKETCLTVWNRIHKFSRAFCEQKSHYFGFSSFVNKKNLLSFFGFKHAAVLTDTCIFKNCCLEHFWKKYFMEMSDFFGFFHLKPNRTDQTNFITICLNFELELTEHIRNRNSIFAGLVHTSLY